MQMNSIRHVFAFFMAALIFNMPFITFAQQSLIDTEAKIEAEARAQGIADAENDANKTAWFMGGCFLNIIGVIIAQTRKAPVPAERLVGKPPAYVDAYTSSYQAKRTEIQTNWALGGCAVIPLAILAGFVALVIAIKHGDGGSWCSPI